MKKSILFLMFLICFEGFSQISLDFQCSIENLVPIKLNSTKVKYLDQNTATFLNLDKFLLYNLDGTLYKTIEMPPKPDSTAYFYGIGFISESLFDNDPSNIEYIIGYYYDSIPGYLYKQVKVIREDGTILLNEMNASPYYSICSTQEGTKLILYYSYANGMYIKTKVFNLQGEIPLSIEDNIDIANDTPTLFPNPNNGSFSIKLQENVHDISTIDLYTTNGKLLKSFKGIGNMIQINHSGLSDGLYFLNIQSKNLNSTKKILIKN